MPTATAVPTGTYNVDPAHSSIGFAVKHMGIATVRGSFKQFAGTIESTDSGLDISGTVEITSVDTGAADRDGHLQSPDFFDAAQFPQITFSAAKVEPAADGKLALTGEITIKGVTKPLTLSGEHSETDEDPWGNQRVGFEVTGKLDRRDFGLEFNQVLGSGNLLVGNDVKLTINVSAVKAS